MSYSLEEKIKNFAIMSRLGILVLQFVANIIVPDHDAKVFQKPHQTDVELTSLDKAVETVFGGLTRWDGQYFLHISQYGYTYENTLAFFPLFPLIVRQISMFISFFVLDHLKDAFMVNNIITLHNMHVLVAVILNNILFIKTATVFFRFSLLVLKKEKLAFVSAILFCINPASIFFSAVYSESLYSFLIFYGLLKIEEKTSLVNYLIIGLAASVRSNGVINIGYLIYKFVKIKCRTKIPFFQTLIFNFGIILSLLPFLMYQFYCCAKYCFSSSDTFPDFITDFGKKNNFSFPGSHPDWCQKPIPIAYTYIQKRYWNVGFLRYYEVKQIPNFILATPMVVIILRGTLAFVRQYKSLILYLGFYQGDPGKELPIIAFPYVLHAFALTVFSVLMINVQVTTRLLASSSPMPYWYCANIIASYLKNPVEGVVMKKLAGKNEARYYYENERAKRSRWKTFLFTEKLGGFPFFIKWYFLSYYIVGTVLFSNYLPWT